MLLIPKTWGWILKTCWDWSLANPRVGYEKWASADCEPPTHGHLIKKTAKSFIAMVFTAFWALISTCFWISSAVNGTYSIFHMLSIWKHGFHVKRHIFFFDSMWHVFPARGNLSIHMRNSQSSCDISVFSKCLNFSSLVKIADCLWKWKKQILHRFLCRVSPWKTKSACKNKPITCHVG